jgi:pimeloyl-ACP methyl ester carboxylesterase
VQRTASKDSSPQVREPDRALLIRLLPGSGSPGHAHGISRRCTRHSGEQQAAGRQAPQPTLYLHGATDGCIRVELARGAERLLAPCSRMVVIDDAGHFLHLEKPDEVNDHILD